MELHMSFVQSELDWVHPLLQGLDGARALTVSLMVKYAEWDQLVNLDCDPSEYLSTDIMRFRSDYQATELLRKCADLPTTIDTRAAALNSFWAAEQHCVKSNRRLYQVRQALIGPFHYGVAPGIIEFVKSWQKNVAAMLGPIPSDLLPKFSSGSTFDDRRFILPMDKLSSRPTITRPAYSVVEPLWRPTLWCRSLCQERPSSSSPRFVRGNRFTVVPKNAKTDRGICIEPSLNVTYQLAVGTVIRKRLRDEGVDIKTGQHRHKKLVESASLTKALATIDLSSASDTVCYEVVRLGLGDSPWFDLLDTLRSPETFIEGEWHRNAKFSSMGCGFTFELETLLFYSLIKTLLESLDVTADDVLSVYGDDIIMPDRHTNDAIACLRFFGFLINTKKSFFGDVPFRESCGADYFNGAPVRGLYVKQLPNNTPGWIKLANGIYHMAELDRSRFGDLNRYLSSWLRVVNRIPKNDRNFGPVHYGDLVIISDDSTKWKTRVRSQFHELRVTSPVYDFSEYTKYDRKCWTGGSIVSSALLDLIKGSGDTLRKKGAYYYAVPTPFLKPRCTASGWKNKWIAFSLSSNYPAWIKRSHFGL